MPTNSIPFKTAYGKRTREYFCPTGNGFEPEYGYEINKYGQKVLVQTGETNVYQKIQEAYEETKIENILARVAMGDNTMMRPDGIYADLSEVPTNLIEARQQMQQLENLWNGLDNEIKKKYDFDVEKFIGASGSKDWLEDMGLIEKVTKSQPNNPQPAEKGESEA